jgi:hypothetical protein
LLVGVTGNVDLALYTLDEPDRARARLEDALKATQRAAELTHQLLAYSGRAHFSEERLDVSALAAEMVQLLGTNLSDRARVDLELRSDLPKVLADPTLIRQVLMNLLTNAHDALETRGHRLVVRTGTMLCDRDLLANTHVPPTSSRASTCSSSSRTTAAAWTKPRCSASSIRSSRPSSPAVGSACRWCSRPCSATAAP